MKDTVHCPKSREQFLSHERDVTIKTTTGKKQFPSFCTLPRKKLFLHVPTLPCHERNISLSSNHPLKSVHSAGIEPSQSGCQLRKLVLRHRSRSCNQIKESNKDFALKLSGLDGKEKFLCKDRKTVWQTFLIYKTKFSFSAR